MTGEKDPVQLNTNLKSLLRKNLKLDDNMQPGSTQRFQRAELHSMFLTAQAVDKFTTTVMPA